MKNTNLKKISMMLMVMMLSCTIVGCGSNGNTELKDTNEVAVVKKAEESATKDTMKQIDEEKSEDGKEERKSTDVSGKEEEKSETINKQVKDSASESNNSNEPSIENNDVTSSSNQTEENKNTSSNTSEALVEINKQPTPNNGETSKPIKEEANNTSTENNKPAHTHAWVEVTEKYTIPAKTHEEQLYKTERYVIEPAKDVKELVFIGRQCVQCDYRTADSNEMLDHMLETGHSCEGVEEYKTIHYDAVYGEKKVPNGVKVVIDEPEKTGTRVTGYKCSCGATKKK